MMLQKNVIPPHAGIKSRLNRKFPFLDEMNVQIAKSPVPFEDHRLNGNRKKKVLFNNFNATVSQTLLTIQSDKLLMLGHFREATSAYSWRTRLNFLSQVKIHVQLT